MSRYTFPKACFGSLGKKGGGVGVEGANTGGDCSELGGRHPESQKAAAGTAGHRLGCEW